MKHPANTLSLVADIGGTNTRCALAHGRQVLTETIRRYSNSEYTGLESVLRQYLADEGNVDPIAACVAVAGPVRDGCGTLTNLDWQIDEATLRQATKAETVSILNDLQAQGFAIGNLGDDAVRPILAGTGQEAPKDAARLVVGVGTGFNAAPVFETQNGRVVPASESGHMDLPVHGALENRLSKYIEKSHGFAAVEDVLSGRGLERVYDFLGEEAGDPVTASARDIMEACSRGDNERAMAAAAIFAKILGKVCGNLSLVQLPFGGVYLVGGVARAMAPHLLNLGFEESFKTKGRFSDFMSSFPVFVVEDDYAALLGSASYLDHLM